MDHTLYKIVIVGLEKPMQNLPVIFQWAFEQV